MQIKLPRNTLCNNEQHISFEKITALIGENGAGKSSILQSIFTNRLQNQCVTEMKVVCFSSGQNEKFSNLFSNYLAKERQANRGLSLDCCYYDKSWSKLLIFISTIINKDGLVRNFLLRKNYIVTSKDGNDDLSSNLTLSVRVNKAYVNRVQMALQAEVDGETKTLRSSAYHRTLESFINNVIDEYYEFDKPLEETKVLLSYHNFNKPSFIESESAFFDPVITFFTQAADNDYFIEKQSMELKFEDGIELNDISDGEFQLLFLYALTDLFDSENTLFLLDEVDSHLHYKNIENLWTTLHNIKGNAWTTTHLVDSITASQNSIDNLKIVNKGVIQENGKMKAIIERLSVLSRIRSTVFDVCCRVKNIVLIDDDNDWTIFISLAKRKGLEIDRLSSLYIVKQPSSCKDESQPLGQAKFDWIQSLTQSESNKVTKNIFAICDRDNSNLVIDGVVVQGHNFRDNFKVIKNKYRINSFLLSWKRREIKNYLLSYTALNGYGLLEQVHDEDLAPAGYLKENDPGDNKHIRNLKVKEYITPLISDNNGLNKDKLDDYVNKIPTSEISEDIVNMYGFLVSKL